MKRKALIGLLSTNLDPVPLYNCCIDLPVIICKFKIRGIDWVNRKVKAIMLDNNEWKKAEISFPDAVYNRCYIDSAAITERLESVIGKGKVFNGLNLFDKYQVSNILINSGLKNLTIPTYKYRTDLMLAFLNTEGAVLIKPAKGSMGSGVYKIAAEGNEYKVYLRTALSSKVFGNTYDLTDYKE